MKIKLTPLDKLFSQYVRLKANNHCEYCGVYKDMRSLQCSHFHGRRKRSVRWDEDNASALCFTCHIYLGENPYAHTEWFKKRLGSERFEQLNIRANLICKPDQEEIKARLKAKIKTIEEDK